MFLIDFFVVFNNGTITPFFWISTLICTCLSQLVVLIIGTVILLVTLGELTSTFLFNVVVVVFLFAFLISLNAEICSHQPLIS